MALPESVQRAAESALEARTGKSVRILSASALGGGCINPSARVETEDGETFFLKWNPSSASDMFEAEADGLRAMATPRSLTIPEVLGWGGSGTSANPGWLLMEFIPQGRPGPDYGQRLGEGLGALHSSGRMDPLSKEPSSFGWHRDNFIGSLPQANAPDPGWTSFWRDARLEPQFRLARDGGHFSGGRSRILDDLLDRLDSIMGGADSNGPALLHGDLWSGNFYPGPTGDPVLIDPAAYRGVGEVDLAMMELFGSFPAGFPEAYEEVRGWAPEYDAFRRDLYQLYYLLVHVNLFGSSYESGSLLAAERALSGA
jgi:fructosamine-3-kinase